MSRRILVAHASRAGSTAEVAQMIGQVLRESGFEVDVRPVKAVENVVGYDGLVLGSAIWTGKPLPEALRFAAAQQQALAIRPVAYFALCEILREDTPANRERAHRFLAPLQQIKQPVSFAVFAGAKDYSKLPPFVRWVLMNIMKLPEGDWRDWEQIRAWAAALSPRLSPVRPRHATGYVPA